MSAPVLGERVHLIGIGGAGMSGIARILLARGVAVSGSDAKDSRAVLALRAMGEWATIRETGETGNWRDAKALRKEAGQPANPGERPRPRVR